MEDLRRDRGAVLHQFFEVRAGRRADGAGNLGTEAGNDFGGENKSSLR
jgi:hypothetical protein